MTHLFQEIAESIQRRIATGDFAPGDRLPAVGDVQARANRPAAAAMASSGIEITSIKTQFS